MALKQRDHIRLDRLASEIKGGGGLILPSLFGALLQQLLDNGETDHEKMIRITQEVCSGKTQKVAETWGGSWEALTTDAMEQLEHQGYAVRLNGDGHWSLGENFKPGVSLKTIPARKGRNAADHVTVFPKDEREARSHAGFVQTEADRLIRQPRGKPHDHEYFTRLRRSADEHGRLQPIIVDANKRTIDGRHRRDIDPNWPQHTARRADGQPVSTDEEVLATILELDRFKTGEALSKSARAKVEEVLGDLRGTNSTKRTRVETALREDAARSNRQIAELIGVAHPLVAEVRTELEKLEDSSGLLIHVYRDKGRRGGGKTRHADCWCGEGEAEPPEKRSPKTKVSKDDPRIHGAIRARSAAGKDWNVAEVLEDLRGQGVDVSRFTVERARPIVDAEDKVALANQGRTSGWCSLDDPVTLATQIKQHFTSDQIGQLVELLDSDASG